MQERLWHGRHTALSLAVKKAYGIGEIEQALLAAGVDWLASLPHYDRLPRTGSTAADAALVSQLLQRSQAGSFSLADVSKMCQHSILLAADCTDNAVAWQHFMAQLPRPLGEDIQRLVLTAASEAASSGRTAVLQRLIQQHGEELAASDKAWRQRILMTSISQDQPGSVALLLEAGAAVGYNAVSAAAKWRCADLIGMLLAAAQPAPPPLLVWRASSSINLQDPYTYPCLVHRAMAGFTEEVGELQRCCVLEGRNCGCAALRHRTRSHLLVFCGCRWAAPAAAPEAAPNMLPLPLQLQNGGRVEERHWARALGTLEALAAAGYRPTGYQNVLVRLTRYEEVRVQPYAEEPHLVAVWDPWVDDSRFVDAFSESDFG